MKGKFIIQTIFIKKIEILISNKNYFNKYTNIYINFFLAKIIFYFLFYNSIWGWGLGIGDWGLGIGPIPKTQDSMPILFLGV